MSAHSQLTVAASIQSWVSTYEIALGAHGHLPGRLRYMFMKLPAWRVSSLVGLGYFSTSA